MKVRTIRDHRNRHEPVGLKTHGRQYEVSDLEGGNLAALGLVEEVTAEAAPKKPRGKRSQD